MSRHGRSDNDGGVAPQKGDWLLKSLPIITALLIGQTMFLNRVLGELGGGHLTDYRSLPGVDRQLLDNNSLWLQRGSGVWMGFLALSFALVCVILRRRLWPRWSLIPIALLWAYAFLENVIASGGNVY